MSLAVAHQERPLLVSRRPNAFVSWLVRYRAPRSDEDVERLWRNHQLDAEVEQDLEKWFRLGVVGRY